MGRGGRGRLEGRGGRRGRSSEQSSEGKRNIKIELYGQLSIDVVIKNPLIVFLRMKIVFAFIYEM